MSTLKIINLAPLDDSFADVNLTPRKNGHFSCSDSLKKTPSSSLCHRISPSWEPYLKEYTIGSGGNKVKSRVAILLVASFLLGLAIKLTIPSSQYYGLIYGQLFIVSALTIRTVWLAYNGLAIYLKESSDEQEDCLKTTMAYLFKAYLAHTALSFIQVQLIKTAIHNLGDIHLETANMKIWFLLTLSCIFFVHLVIFQMVVFLDFGVRSLALCGQLSEDMLIFAQMELLRWERRMQNHTMLESRFETVVHL